MKSKIRNFVCVPSMLIMLIWIFVGGVLGQKTAAYQHLEPGRFITHWLVLGPLPVFEEAAEPENQALQVQVFRTDFIQPEALTSVATGRPQVIESQEWQWRLLDSPYEVIDLEKIFGTIDFASAYAWTELEVSEDEDILLGVGSDDGVRVWLNGNLVHDNWIGRGLTVDEDVLPLTLRKGTNQLLLKVQDMQFDWAFCCRVLDPTEIAIQRSRALVQEVRQRASVPGMSVAVGVNGKVVWSEGFGFADLEQRVAVSNETRFRIGSVSKPLTAAAVGLLVEQGELDLDAPVQQYVPSFAEKRWPFTTRQVAGHLAGIRHYRDQEFLSNIHYNTVLEGLEIFDDDTLLFEPGSRFSYSSYAWNLVSAVVEGASNEPFLDFMQKSVLEPLAMHHTCADEPELIIPYRTRFYERRREGDVRNAPFVDNSYKWAGGGFLSTAPDLVRFGMAHLNGTLLNPETVDMLWKSQHTKTGRETGYGIGWFIDTDHDGRRVISHGGGSIGGSAFLLLFPNEDVVLAMLANSSAPTGFNEAWSLAEPFLLSPHDLSASPEQQPNLAGLYECTTTDNREVAQATIHLLGSPGDYWGRVSSGTRHYQIQQASSRQNDLRLTLLSPEGGISNIWLMVQENNMIGRWDQRPITATRARGALKM